MVFLAGCGAENSGTPDAAPDAATDWQGEFTWRIRVNPSDAIVRIDGVERDELTIVTAGEAAARELEVVVESEVGGVIASTLTLRAECDDHCAPIAWWERSEHLCSYASGELRFLGVSCEGVGAGCSGDAFCYAECGTALVCQEGSRCGIDRVDAAPGYGWLACLPIGPVAEGGACTIDAAGLDDCGAQLHCVDGTCHRACRPIPDDIDQCGGVACEPVPGMSPEVGVCPP